jgi:hypothetical protein
MGKTIIGLYDHLEQVEAVVRELTEAGLGHDEISLLANSTMQGRVKELESRGLEHRGDELPTEDAAKGAGIGAFIGTIAGLQAGLIAVAIPGLGPLLAAGAVGTVLASGGIGAAAGTVIGAVLGVQLTEEEEDVYREAIRRGGLLVVVNATDDTFTRAEEIMNRHDPVDLDTRVANWRGRGWNGYDPEAPPLTEEEMARELELCRAGEPGPCSVRTYH